MTHHTGHVMINVYLKNLCARENVQKVTISVGGSVYPLVKCKTINLVQETHSVFLMKFMKGIGGLVMVNAYQIEICVMGNAMKGLKNVVTTLAYLLIKCRIIKLVMIGVIVQPISTEISGHVMGLVFQSGKNAMGNVMKDLANVVTVQHA